MTTPLTRLPRIVLVAAVLLVACGSSEGDGTPLTTTDVIQGYSWSAFGHCEMDGRRVDIGEEGVFVEHLPPNQLLLRSYLGCQVGGPVLDASATSLTASMSNSWTDPGCWLLLGPSDAIEPFEMRALSASGTLLYDRATESVQIDVVYEGQWGGVPRTMTCTHYAEHLPR